ncbi:MAG: hypothetical protein K2M95_06050 [Clostridiales bacterium]|nr:hypothetical protein [Clostridiales bacterium]
MKVCSSCGKEGDDAYVACPFCGTQYEDATPANEDATQSVEEPQAEERTAAAETMPEAEEPEEKSVWAKKEFGKKAERFEKKNHFIVNGIVALFSLLLFIMTFFAGAKIALALTSDEGFFSLLAEDEEEIDLDFDIDEAYFDYLYGKPDGINQSTIDILVGAFGLIETDKDKMAKYISDVSVKYAEALEDAYKKYEKDIARIAKIKDEEKAEKEAEKLLKKMADYAAKKSGVNVIKVNYYMARLHLLENNGMINAYTGSAVAIVTGVLLLGTLISTFVFTILAAASLAKRRPVTKPFRALTTPLAFLLTAFAIGGINPIATVNGVSVACVVLSLVGILLLCAAKRLIVDEASTFTVKSLIRGGVSLLCTLIAFFLLCGTLFTVKIGKYTVHASMGLAVRELLRGASYGGDRLYSFGRQIGDTAFMTQTGSLLVWIFAVTLAAKCVFAAWHDLYTGNDGNENGNGKKTSSMGFSIAAAVLTVVSLVPTFITFSACKPSVSVGIVFALVFWVGSAVAKAVLVSKQQNAEEDEE